MIILVDKSHFPRSVEEVVADVLFPPRSGGAASFVVALRRRLPFEATAQHPLHLLAMHSSVVLRGNKEKKDKTFFI